MATDTQKPAVPLVERGYVSQSIANWWGFVDDHEQTPELRWPLSIMVFDAMRRQDAQVSSVLRAVTHPIRQTTWRIDGTGCRDEVVRHVANDLGLPIAGQEDDPPVVRTQDRFTWGEHLRMALLMLPFGHMFFEQVYRIDDAGLAHLRKLGPRMPRTIAAINVARDGGLESIQQWMLSGKFTKIPATQLVAYVHDREGGNWAGTSLLRPAYKNWLIKDRLLRVQAQTIDRNGLGVPLYEGAEKESDLSGGLKLAQAWRSGDNSGAAIPNGAKLTLKGVEGTLPNADGPIRYHDEQIAASVLAHALNLGQQTGTGSYALGSTFMDMFTASLQALAQEVADTATAHIVEDLVDINWGPTEPAPKVTFDEIGSRQSATAQGIALLVQTGVITPDQALEAYLRQAMGIPQPSGAVHSIPGTGSTDGGTA